MRKTAVLVLLGAAGLMPAAACNDGPQELTSVCPLDTRYANGACLSDYEVSVNSVGYLPERRKMATFNGDSGDFSVRRVSDDEEVLSGMAEGPVKADDTDEQVYLADFTELTEPGEYYVEAGEGRSAPFRVGGDALDDALRVSMLGLYGQRCGEEVEIEFEGDTYRHGACHLKKASLARVGGGEKDDTGGWHDAGDYGKYTRNAAFSVAFLLAAYEHFPDFVSDFELEIPENGNDVPDMLDEARVQLEWLLKVQFDDGSFAHKVTALNFEPVVMPAGDDQQRFFVSTSSHSTGNAVAVLAQGSRLFEQYDADFAGEMLSAAEAGQKWLEENPEEVEADQSGISTGPYSSEGDSDERLWAATELWETTGSPDYLAQAETLLADVDYWPPFDWPHAQPLAMVTYGLSEREGRDPVLLDEVQGQLLSGAETIATYAHEDAYGRGFGSYYWGTNGVVARLAFGLVAAHKLRPDTYLLDAITAQIDHLLGRNGHARSFVSRLGGDPVHSPHHRPSEADSYTKPWPGLLVGGPHGGDVPAMNWEDEYENYEHNEIAINWNTALVYALVAAIGTRQDVGDGCGGPCEMGGAGGVGGAGGAGAN